MSTIGSRVNILQDSFVRTYYLLIDRPIGSWFLNIYSRLLLTWALANLNLAVPRSKKLFLQKSLSNNRSSPNQTVWENCDLTNIFPHLFNFLSFSLVVCWEVCGVFYHSCTALCLKYASHKRFQKSIGYMALVNLQKLYHCLWKLSLLNSRWIACIACFFREKIPKFSFG